MFEFEYPLFLLLIFVFIFGSVFLKLKVDAMIFPSFAHFPKSKSVLLIALKWLGLALCIIALASPVKKENLIKRKEPSHAIVLILDVSGSMSNNFFGKDGRINNKFKVAKNIASEFIKQRRDDHVGIVIFGDFAYVASPLSYDTNSVSVVMKNIKEGIAGNKTALNDSIFVAASMLKNTKAKEKIAILLSDGADNSSYLSQNEALSFAKEQKLKIYTLFIGDRLAEAHLQAIAEQSGGKFYAAHSKDTLRNVYDEINKLETSKLDSKPIFQKDYFYQWFLFFGLIFLMIYAYFKQRKILI